MGNYGDNYTRPAFTPKKHSSRDSSVKEEYFDQGSSVPPMNDRYEERSYIDTLVKAKERSSGSRLRTKSEIIDKREPEVEMGRTREREIIQSDPVVKTMLNDVIIEMERLGKDIELLRKDGSRRADQVENTRGLIHSGIDEVLKEQKKIHISLAERMEIIKSMMKPMIMKPPVQNYDDRGRGEAEINALLAQVELLDDKLKALMKTSNQAAMLEADNLKTMQAMLEQMKNWQQVVASTTQYMQGFTDTFKKELIEAQGQYLESKEEIREKEFSVTRTYFRTILWLLLIIIAMFAAYVLGFIGPTP